MVDTENTPASDTPEATTDTNQNLQDAVDLASDILVMARDQKNTGITVLMAPADEVAALRSFVARGKQQVAASKNIASLALAKAKERNAGRKLPPSKQPKAKPAGK